MTPNEEPGHDPSPASLDPSRGSARLGAEESWAFDPPTTGLKELRDRFAAVALAELVGSGPMLPTGQEAGWPAQAARLAYAFADAMLDARRNPGPPP